MTQPVDPIAAVRGKFLARCKDDVAELEAAASDPGGQRELLKFTVHRLSGAAGVFGFPKISEMAGDLDDVLHQGEDADPAEILALAAAVRGIL